MATVHVKLFGAQVNSIRLVILQKKGNATSLFAEPGCCVSVVTADFFSGFLNFSWH